MKEQKKVVTFGRDKKIPGGSGWAFWFVIKSIVTRVIDWFRNTFDILFYVVEAIIGTVLNYSVVILFLMVPLALMYFLTVYGDVAVGVITAALDLVITLFNLMINFVNQLGTSGPLFGDLWNAIMDMVMATLEQLGNIIQNGIPEVDITKGIKSGTFKAPDKYFDSSNLKQFSSSFVDVAQLVINVAVVWVKISIMILSTVVGFFKAIICGKDDCESVCGRRGCFNFLVVVYWIFSFIYWICITVGVFLGNTLQLLLDLIKFPIQLEASVRHIVVYLLLLISDFDSVLNAVWAFFINLIVPVPDYLLCSLFTDGFKQFGPCIFRPPCRALLVDISIDFGLFKIVLPLRQWICDAFGTVCECGRCTWYFGLLVPCVLHPECTRCAKPWTFMDTLFPSLVERCLTCTLSELLNRNWAAPNRESLCPAYCYNDPTAYSLAVATGNGCPPDNTYRPLHCKKVS